MSLHPGIRVAACSPETCSFVLRMSNSAYTCMLKHVTLAVIVYLTITCALACWCQIAKFFQMQHYGADLHPTIT